MSLIWFKEKLWILSHFKHINSILSKQSSMATSICRPRDKWRKNGETYWPRVQDYYLISKSVLCWLNSKLRKKRKRMGQCFGNKLHTLHPMVWCFILNIKQANSDSGSVDLPQADGCSSIFLPLFFWLKSTLTGWWLTLVCVSQYKKWSHYRHDLLYFK